MVSNMDKSLCTGCGVCSAICPVHCITMKEDKAGFLYPIIDESVCIGCNKCDRICHVQNVSSQGSNKPIAYVAYNKDKEQRKNSSSGGIFILLAEEFLDKKGIVYGAAYDENWSVSHIRVETKEGLYKLQGSKYVQSKTHEDVYASIHEDLENGKEVLYSGTPCQIGALKRYLSKDYDRLLTVSFICHGVPSPALWEQYVREQKLKHNSEIKHVSHRNKKYGWTKSSMMMLFENEDKYVCMNQKDPYLQLFLKNTCLRDSCYDCQYKGVDKLSFIDIMLADKWGQVRGSLPNMYDDKGISLIFVQTKKGTFFLEKVKEKMYYDATSFEEAVISNSAYNKSASMHVNRNKVQVMIGNYPVETIYKMYAKTPFKVRCKIALKNGLYKVAKICGIVWLVRKMRHGK